VNVQTVINTEAEGPDEDEDEDEGEERTKHAVVDRRGGGGKKEGKGGWGLDELMG
jgi:hypothetical protein